MALMSRLSYTIEGLFLHTFFYITYILQLLHLETPLRNLLHSITPAPKTDGKLPDINKVILKTIKVKLDHGFPASKLWEEYPCLVVVVRRPGCLLCREDAANIARHAEKIQGYGVQLAAVVHEKFGAEDFGRRHWNGLPLFYDEKKDMYKLLGNGKFNWMALDGWVSHNAIKNALRARKDGFKGNLKGEGRILGGLFIVSKEGIHYEYAEKEWGDHAPIEEVLQICHSFAKKQ